MGLISGLEHMVREDELLARHTWLRLGGPAEFFAEPTTVDELATLVKRCREQEITVRLMGGGSNLLVPEAGVQGVVVHLATPAFVNIRVDGQRVVAGGGARLTHVLSSAAREGLAGLESLAGIPGTVGGALHNNSGRPHADIGQCTSAATVMTRAGDIIRRDRNDLQFAYRQSSLNELVILEGEFELESEDPVELTKRMQKLWIVAKANHPGDDQNSGRVFKNPHGVRAADLIEQLGLKGHRVGRAVLSERHANFVVADPGCGTQDVLDLIELVRIRVNDELGIELENEIDVW